MDEQVPRWVRIGVLVTMAVPQLMIGLWAVLSPKGWFDSFPGFDPRLVAAEPPYNEHLASDAGAGFLATGAGLLAAVVWARRAAIHTALLAFVAFTLPHAAWHALNPSDALSGAEDVMNTFMLASGLGLAALFAYGVSSSGFPRRSAAAAKATASPAARSTTALR